MHRDQTHDGRTWDGREDDVKQIDRKKWEALTKRKVREIAEKEAK